MSESSVKLIVLKKLVVLGVEDAVSCVCTVILVLGPGAQEHSRSVTQPLGCPVEEHWRGSYA